MARAGGRKGQRTMRGVRVVPIEPTGIYVTSELPALLRVGRDTITEEIHAGRIPYKEVAGRHLFLGRDLLAWFRVNQEPPQEPRGAEGVGTNGRKAVPR